MHCTKAITAGGSTTREEAPWKVMEPRLCLSGSRKVQTLGTWNAPVAGGLMKTRDTRSAMSDANVCQYIKYIDADLKG